MLKLELSSQAEGFLDKLNTGNKKFAILIAKKIKNLLSNPVSTDSKKLTGLPYYRVRVGNYRVVYKFDNTILFVVAIDTRGRIYRGL
jgi:mRNA interferase RelE/StbE